METSNSPIFNRKTFNMHQLTLWTMFVVGLIFATIISAFITPKLSAVCGMNSVISISMIIQDLFVFILPAFAVAYIATRKPFSYLALDTCPSGKMMLYTIVIFIVSMPALNEIILWNENLSLPDSMQAIEQWMRSTEEAAQYVTDMFLHNNSFVAMIGCILLVGLLTGFSEELFFRGGLQGIFLKHKINHHLTIWFVAIIFSILHFQFFGFLPRLLLGAMFGYLANWSGSLWTAVLAHTLNNSVVVISNYLSDNDIYHGLDTLGTSSFDGFPALALLSVVLTAGLLYKHKYFFTRENA